MFFKKSGTKKCPKCAEVIKSEAVVCRYCGARLDGSGGGSAARASGFKARFSPEEWSLVMSVPFLFFGMTAGADGNIDDAEAAELQRRMQGGAFGYKDPLHREVAADFFSTAVTLDELIRKANAAGPEKVRSTLKAKLSDDEYQGYVSSVFVDAMAIAKVSGGISSTETTALAALAAFFGVDISGLKTRFGS